MLPTSNPLDPIWSSLWDTYLHSLATTSWSKGVDPDIVIQLIGQHFGQSMVPFLLQRYEIKKDELVSFKHFLILLLGGCAHLKKQHLVHLNQSRHAAGDTPHSEIAFLPNTWKQTLHRYFRPEQAIMLANNPKAPSLCTHPLFHNDLRFLQLARPMVQEHAQHSHNTQMHHWCSTLPELLLECDQVLAYHDEQADSLELWQHILSQTNTENHRIHLLKRLDLSQHEAYALIFPSQGSATWEAGQLDRLVHYFMCLKGGVYTLRISASQEGLANMTRFLEAWFEAQRMMHAGTMKGVHLELLVENPEGISAAHNLKFLKNIEALKQQLPEFKASVHLHRTYPLESDNIPIMLGAGHHIPHIHRHACVAAQSPKSTTWSWFGGRKKNAQTSQANSMSCTGIADPDVCHTLFGSMLFHQEVQHLSTRDRFTPDRLLQHYHLSQPPPALSKSGVHLKPMPRACFGEPTKNK